MPGGRSARSTRLFSGDHRFAAVRATCVVVNLAVTSLLLLVGVLGPPVPLAQGLAVGIGFAFRFALLTRVVYAARRLPGAPLAMPESYDASAAA